MFEKLKFKLRYLAIAILVISFIAACKSNSVRQSSNPQLTDCRTVRHVLGEVCVPKTPQRLVSLDDVTLADALTVGVPSIGVSLYDNHLPNYLEEKIDFIELLGTSEQPNLEKMVRLNPDSIVGIELSAKSIYPQLSQIAPTAVGKWNGYPDWREYFDFVASVLSKEAEAQAVWKKYDRRVAEIKNRLGDLRNTKVSFAYACCGGISIDTENSFSGSIMADLGIPRPKSHAAVDDGLIILSEERISDLDADILFLSVYNDEESEQVLANLQQKPLWNQLKAVQNQRVYPVNYDIWRGGNPIAANLVLDDLEKYLIDSK